MAHRHGSKTAHHTTTTVMITIFPSTEFCSYVCCMVFKGFIQGCKRHAEVQDRDIWLPVRPETETFPLFAKLRRLILVGDEIKILIG